MKRSIGALMVLGAWIIVPSVAIWLLGGPLWAWVAIIGGLGVAFLVILCCVTLFTLIAEKLGPDYAFLCILVPIGVIALTQAIGFSWWGTLAALGVLAAIPVGLLGLKWLIDE